ncbi:MAG: hypothetical protein ACE5PV_18270 [Candidatus Poribacteria bacterium]
MGRFWGQNERGNCKKFWQQNEAKEEIFAETFDVAWVDCTVKIFDGKMAIGRGKGG